MIVLQEQEWHNRRAKYLAELKDFNQTYFLQRKQNKKHAVYDFLFEYFSFPYSKLATWSGGFDIKLEGEYESLFFDGKYSFVKRKENLHQRLEGFSWILTLLNKTKANNCIYNCYNMHEWAMVYKSQEYRHSYLPLRFSQEKIDSIVEQETLLCSHFDAFRFYTKDAKTLNANQLTRKSQHLYEQSACLHANMDLYKWAYKAYPYINSELIFDCFKLAWQCRTIDMQASPYDLSMYNIMPIKIETSQGKKEYVKEQKNLQEQAAILRDKLLIFYSDFLKWL